MSSLRLILASLRHHRRIHVAVGLGVCVAATVLTGALLVGDSVRGSLRELTIQRLGRISHALVTPQPFREELAAELASTEGFATNFRSAHPALLLVGTLETGSTSNKARATGVAVVGYDPNFGELADALPGPLPQEPAVVLTESVARELQVAEGDEILLRVPAFDAMPADSPLGEKIEVAQSRRLRVAAVWPPEGLARFGLQPSQHEPRNAFVPLAALQDLLEQPGAANAILVAADQAATTPPDEATATLQAVLRPSLEDYGLEVVERDPAGGVPYLEVKSKRLVLTDEVVAAIERAFPDLEFQPVVTYLANTIRAGDRSVPYSTVTGIDSTTELGPLHDENGEPLALADDEIVLNRWAADDLGANVGDEISITFYEPESTHGELQEHAPVVFRLRAIAELVDAQGKPTAAANPHFTPELKGVTDKRSINDWELPFELVEPIRRQDEDYWDAHSTTPKAFVSLATAKRLWHSRWGTISLLRTPRDETTDVEAFRTKLAASLDPAAMGFAFLPVKQQGLAASSGTTPFDGLFLGFSMFLIASALMLIVLLFRLGVEQRAGEIGILAAVGLNRGNIARMFSREALVVAALGALLGIAGGIGYAALMVTGLNTIWRAAIATPFLELHWTWRSLLLGWLLSVLATWLAIRFALRELVALPARRLLAGVSEDVRSARSTRRWLRVAEMLMLAVALGLLFTAAGMEGEAAAFFGSGAAVLAALLIHTHLLLSRQVAARRPARRLSLARLAIGNAARNPGRSTLTIGLVAAASFLIVAISAFHIDTSDSGTGGFAIYATSDQPIHFDLNSADGRWELGLSDETSDVVAAWHFESLRVYDGEDASCLSLYRPTQPRVLGVPDWTTQRAPFAFAATRANAENADPWQALNADLGTDARGLPIVPVVLDANTAMYSLQIYGGVGAQLTIRDGFDQPTTLEIVGLLKNSMLQGDLLVSEANFVRLFPETAGYRLFLARAPRDQQADSNVVAQFARTLESSALGDYGFDATSADQRLADFLAVQNTYLSTFQSLGALGLLLGTLGLAVVQLRSVLKRRGELALMRAEGFGRRRLVQLVLLENGALLVGGLVIGCAAAAVALLPHWAPREASVPWAALAVLLAAIALAGTLAAWLSTRRALSAPIVPALRGE